MKREDSNKQKYAKDIDFKSHSQSYSESDSELVAQDVKVTHSRNKSRKKAKGIIIHCSDSPQGRGDNAATIDRWHKERGWLGIGYHYVILENGLIEDGRSRNRTGAHAKGYNHFVGICLIGIDSFTDEQFKSLEILIKELDTKDIRGHYEVSHKTCPNFNVSEFLEEIEHRDTMEKIRQTEIFNEYSSHTPDNDSHAQIVAHKQVQAKVQPKESKTLLGRLNRAVCAFCR